MIEPSTHTPSLKRMLCCLGGLLIILSATSCHRRTYKYTSIESAILSFEDKEYELVYLDSADINGDGREDALLVIQEKISRAEGARPLILLESHRKRYRMTFQNDSLIYDIESGPYSSVDCFVSVSLDRDSIAINYYGGMSTRWSEVQVFRYDGESKTYLLESQSVSSDNIYDDIEEADVYHTSYEATPIAIDTIRSWHLE